MNINDAKIKASKLQSPEERIEFLLYLFENNYSPTTISKIFKTKVVFVADILRSLGHLPQLNTLICIDCGKEKFFEEFPIASNKISGRQGKCNVCWSNQLSRNYHNNSEYHKQQSLIRQQSEKGKHYRKKYDNDNREHINKYHREYHNLPSQQQYHKSYRDKNKNHRNEYNKKWFNDRYHTDIQFRIHNTFGTRMYHAIKDLKSGRSWELLVDYTLDDLIKHLELQFQNGMTWDNYGQWHIDHIKPVSSFNFDSTDDSEFKECWSLNNLQPLWAEDNLKKSNKIL